MIRKLAILGVRGLPIKLFSISKLYYKLCMHIHKKKMFLIKIYYLEFVFYLLNK